MNKHQRRQRAKRRSEQWAAEKVLAALADFGTPPRSDMVLRHGRSMTFDEARSLVAKGQANNS